MSGKNSRKTPYDKPHECPQCDLSFGRPAHLTRHVRLVHEGKKDHACPHTQCAAAFGRASALTIHVQTVHEKRRDHKCTECEAAFGTASNLTKHVRTVHGGKKDHACAQCEAAFSTAQSLTAHVHAVHEKRRDHACTQCEAAFGTASNLTKHVRTVHKGAGGSAANVAAEIQAAETFFDEVVSEIHFGQPLDILLIQRSQAAADAALDRARAKVPSEFAPGARRSVLDRIQATQVEWHTTIRNAIAVRRATPPASAPAGGPPTGGALLGLAGPFGRMRIQF